MEYGGAPFQHGFSGPMPAGAAPVPPEPLSAVATRINERLAKQLGVLLHISERVGYPPSMPGEAKIDGPEPAHLSWQLRKMETILSDLERQTEGLSLVI